MNLVANTAKSARFLKYITPFGYCDGADIIADGKLNGLMVLIGAGIGAAGVFAAYVKYLHKDIA